MASRHQEKVDEQVHQQKNRGSFDDFPWFLASSLSLFSLRRSHLLESMPQGIARTIHEVVGSQTKFDGLLRLISKIIYERIMSMSERIMNVMNWDPTGREIVVKGG